MPISLAACPRAGRSRTLEIFVGVYIVFGARRRAYRLLPTDLLRRAGRPLLIRRTWSAERAHGLPAPSEFRPAMALSLSSHRLYSLGGLHSAGGSGVGSTGSFAVADSICCGNTPSVDRAFAPIRMKLSPRRHWTKCARLRRARLRQNYPAMARPRWIPICHHAGSEAIRNSRLLPPPTCPIHRRVRERGCASS